MPGLKSLICVLAIGTTISSVMAQDAPAKKPKFTISKETTYITEPMAADGLIDYAKALNDRLSRGVTPDNNAVVLLYRAMPKPDKVAMPDEFFKLLKMERPPEQGEYFLDLGTFLQEKAGIRPQDPALRGFYDQQSLAAEHPWADEQYPQIAKWLETNEKPLSLIVEATKRPRYYSPLIVSKDEKGQPAGLVSALLPGVQQSRSFARALLARSMLHLGDGKTEAAWEDLLATHRLARQIAEGPTLIEGLVGMAIESMASQTDLIFLKQTKPDAKPAKAYLEQIQKLGPMPTMREKIDLTERFMFLDSTLLVARGGPKVFNELGFNNNLDNVLMQKILSLVDWDVVLKRGNEFYDRIDKTLAIENRAKRLQEIKKIADELEQIENASEELKEITPEDLKDAPGKVVSPLVGNVMVRLLFPAVFALNQAEERSLQRYKNLQLAFALAAYRSDHGSYPKSLDALAPTYLNMVPNDIFSGKPLKYRGANDSYLLYSIGPNEQDDEGRFFDDMPPGDDIRVRMPSE